MPIWRAWYARHGIGHEVEFLVKILATRLKTSEWEDLRPDDSLQFDNPFDLRADEVDSMSISVARKMQGMVAGLLKMFPNCIKGKKDG